MVANQPFLKGVNFGFLGEKILYFRTFFFKVTISVPEVSMWIEHDVDHRKSVPDIFSTFSAGHTIRIIM